MPSDPRAATRELILTDVGVRDLLNATGEERIERERSMFNRLLRATERAGTGSVTLVLEVEPRA